MRRVRQESPEKAELLNFVFKEYGLDAAKGHGFRARLSRADLRKLKAYAVRARGWEQDLRY